MPLAEEGPWKIPFSCLSGFGQRDFAGGKVVVVPRDAGVDGGLAGQQGPPTRGADHGGRIEPSEDRALRPEAIEMGPSPISLRPLKLTSPQPRSSA